MLELLAAGGCLVLIFLVWLTRTKPLPPPSPHFDTGYVLVWRIGQDPHHLILCHRSWDGFIEADDADIERIRRTAKVYPTIEEAVAAKDAINQSFKEGGEDIRVSCETAVGAVERISSAVRQQKEDRMKYEAWAASPNPKGPRPYTQYW